MKLTFDSDFDHGAWPGPLGGRTAAAGEDWVGELGLLGRLEVALGVGDPPVSRAERAAALVPRLRAVEGFWTRSAEVDPLGTAERLLEWRDELWLRGWRGEVPADSAEVPGDAGQLDLRLQVPMDAAAQVARRGSPSAGRLRQLAAVTAGGIPGIPDRLLEVAAALERHSPSIEEVAHFASLDELAPLWRRVFDLLARNGTSLRLLDLPPVPAAERDLHAARARSSDFAPRGDGSLQLLRPYGPLAAAEEVAAWLAAQPSLEGALIVAADGVLDAALRRYGLPTTGAVLPPRENLLLQILPLVLDLGWHPADPQRALQLLTLPTGPVPRSLARGLARALHEWPAVDSDEWRRELVQGLTELPDERRARVASRLETIFAAAGDRPRSYPASEIQRRTDALEAWARASQAVAASGEQERWLPPLEQMAKLRRLLALSGLAELSAAQLQWFVEAATESVVSAPPRPAQAGLATVGAPGSIAGAARIVVWWNFSLETAPPLRRLPFSPAERRALAASGVELPDPGAEAVRQALRWRRPLEQTRETLLLVAPQRRENGDEDFPHPLWDEIAARLSLADLQRLERPTPRFVAEPPRRPGALRAVVRPTRAWRASAAVFGAEQSQSPSSLTDFIGCSLKWSLEKTARIRAGETGTLPMAEQLAGKLAHEILSRLLTGPPLGPEAAREEAFRVFDRQGPRLAAPYFLPGADAARAEARLSIGLAAEVLTGILAAAGMRVEMAEQNIVCEAGDWQGRLHGRPDLVVGPPRAVVDLKWGWASGRRRELENGTALQLAAYSRMLRPTPTATWPPVAYFILRTQQLLTTSAIFRGEERIQGAGPEETWSRVEAAHADAWERLRQGSLLAPGNPDEAGEVHPEADDIDLEGRLVLQAPCTFCELGALCGHALWRELGS
jgi:hypothetical protein